MLGRRGVLALSVTAVMAAAGAVQLLPGAAPVAHAAGLSPYRDCEALLTHYRQEVWASATPYGFGFGNGFAVDAVALADGASSGGVAARSSAEAGSSAPGAAVGQGATGTNLQEQGVDEPDLVKLADGRLVVLARNAVQVLSAQDDPQLLGSLRLGGGPAYGGELMLVGDRAVVVVPGFRERPQSDLPHLDKPGRTDRLSLYFPGTPTTRLVLVDLSTNQPRLLEDATYDGQYVSARLVGETVRLVTTTAPAPATMQPQAAGEAAETTALAANRRTAAALPLSEVLPQVVRRDADGTVLEQGNAVGCSGVTHARVPRGTSTLLVTTMQPAKGLDATDRTAVTTDGDLVYASQDRLYVATSRWGTVGPVDVPRRGSASRVRPATDEVSTEIHGFDTASATATTYVGTGTVPGYVLGRWALSEHEGVLRVATTRQPPWSGEVAVDASRGTAQATSSMLVKLVERDGALVETGRVEGLGRTEHIKAVRYFGDLAAVVTFRQTDPLYLVDLSAEPKVVGELKVPGFSTYLHPIGDGLLLGLGQDATEDGQVTGMQLSVFDVSDLSNPALVDRLPIGQGYSPALDDSRAFAYDPDRRLALLPFYGYDESIVDGAGNANVALGVSVDDDGHLREVGTIETGPENPLSRVLLDDGRAFAVGESGVVAGDATTMTRTGTADFARG